MAEPYVRPRGRGAGRRVVWAAMEEVTGGVDAVGLPDTERAVEPGGAVADAGVDAAVDGAVDDAPVDGRTARALRTRESIVDACVELVNDGDPRPTAPRIAARAGVSVRSVFQHFDDLETLFTMVAERAVAGLGGLVEPIDADLPFAARRDRFVAQRAQLLEALTPIRRAAAVHGFGSPAIQGHLHHGHELLRAQLKSVFGPEIAAVPRGRRRRVIDMLDVATIWSSWDALRTYEGRTPDEAAAVMADLITAALAVGSDPARSDAVGPDTGGHDTDGPDSPGAAADGPDAPGAGGGV